MSHIPYTIRRSNTYYYNRRVPKHAVESYGQFIRLTLSKDPLEAAAFSRRLSDILDGVWNTTKNAPPVNLSTIIESFQPRRVALSEIAAEYLALKRIDLTPPRVAVSAFISVAGDRDVSEYTRQDAKMFVHHLKLKGNKTATIRRKGYSGSPTTSLYTPWTEAEVLAHLATGWGEGAISELKLEYLYGPEPEVSG